MADLSRIRNLTVERSFEFYGETITLKIAPARLPSDLAVAMSDSAMDWETVKQSIVKAIVEWNLTEDGRPYPVTVDALGSLPPALVRAIIETVATTIADEGKAFGGTSSQAASSATFHGGTPSS